MSQLLSVILPVRNVEYRLAEKAVELLEVVAELTSKVELLIVDDGSTDDTEEVASELSRHYPQIRILRCSEQLGELGAARAGIANTTGEVVLIHNIDSPLSSDAIQQFWTMRNDKELVFARSESAHTKRMPHTNTMANEGWAGTQMLRREAVNELQEMQTRTNIDRVMRTDVGDTSNPSLMLRQLTDSHSQMPARHVDP